MLYFQEISFSMEQGVLSTTQFHESLDMIYAALLGLSELARVEKKQFRWISKIGNDRCSVDVPDVPRLSRPGLAPVLKEFQALNLSTVCTRFLFVTMLTNTQKTHNDVHRDINVLWCMR
jgi:hypothetical protein